MSRKKNIWVAAGDGDLPRVQELVEQESLSPNAPDPFTYTPMHAAASYGHIQVLAYLVNHGGNVNITDEDGDTPLYTVENIDTAQWLVSHGAIVDRRNNEGVSPVEHLEEDFPDVAAFLRSQMTGNSILPSEPPVSLPSEHQQETASERLTSALMLSVQDIIQRADADGRDPDEDLRKVVSQTVLGGVMAGYQMSNETDQEPRRESGPAKRLKTEDDGAM
ncbi:ankyrin repeat-containing domain protein [Scleroderma citrinum]